MSEQQIDFKKITIALKSQKFTPEQIGSLMRQYYVKHLKDDSCKVDSLTQTIDDAVKIFDGSLFTSY